MQRKFFGLIIAVLVILGIVLGLNAFLSKENNENPQITGGEVSEITDFETCIAAGNPAMESYPRQCAANGLSFTEELGVEADCKRAGGNWQADYNECENIMASWCASYGGTYNECASACRHDENATICTMQCVTVCNLDVISPSPNAPILNTYKDMVKILFPLPDNYIKSPMIVKGEVKGSWFFEGSFHVVLTDWDGKIIAETNARVDTSNIEDIKANNYLPFSAVLEFENPEYKNNGSLILQKQNASGLPQYEDAFEIPIFFKSIKEKFMFDPQKEYIALLKTSEGDIEIELNQGQTPNTVKNFVDLAESNFYDSTVFHRVIKNFMIQGGDPKGDGTGGPDYRFDDEPFTGEYNRGTVAMANAGPNTNGSQFFIMHADYPLPKNYVIFGSVSKGLDVLDKIANSEVTNNTSGELSKPVEPVMLESVDIKTK